MLAERGPDLLVMAGGTIAMMRMNEGHLLPDQVMGLRRVGLDAITNQRQAVDWRDHDSEHFSER
ncbi:MAG: hypothetical protein H6633_28015 [Anaerolineales bacterium]|nr:hypothetical protein [Anaerolineales bacterium]